MKKLLVLLLAGILAIIPIGGCAPKEKTSIGMAVEFNAHSAPAYISQDKGWYEQEGLKLSAYESYATGVALAAALARGDIGVAYICLAPAINAYANAGVPIRIVAGTHKYGYGLVVNPDKIKNIADLEKPGIRLGCIREGGATDVLMHKMIDKYNLDEEKILANVQRMDPSKQVLALKMGQLDAGFLPEHWATMAEESGFRMLLTSQDIWPQMQGSVLVVKQDLINNHPELVRKLVAVSQKAVDWINEHPDEAAEVMARQLQTAPGTIPSDAPEGIAELETTPQLLLKSMNRLEYTMEIDPEEVQATIDYIAGLGYIKTSFAAEDILDLKFLEGK